MARKNAIEMYLTNNKRKSVVAEKFIRTLKKKIYKYISVWLQYQKMCMLLNYVA